MNQKSVCYVLILVASKSIFDFIGSEKLKDCFARQFKYACVKVTAGTEVYLFGKSFTKSILLFLSVFLVGNAYLFFLKTGNKSILVNQNSNYLGFDLLSRDFFVLLTLMALFPAVRNRYQFQPDVKTERECLQQSLLIPICFTFLQLLLGFISNGGFTKINPIPFSSDILYQYLLKLVWLVLFGPVLSRILGLFKLSLFKKLAVQLSIFLFATVVFQIKFGGPSNIINVEYLTGLLPKSICTLVVVFENLFGMYFIIFGLLINFLCYGVLYWLGYSTGDSSINTLFANLVILVLIKQYFKKIPEQKSNA